MRVTPRPPVNRLVLAPVAVLVLVLVPAQVLAQAPVLVPRLAPPQVRAPLVLALPPVVVSWQRLLPPRACPSAH